MVAKVHLPAQARRGEIIDVRIVIRHPMETGFRYDHFGKPIAKNVVNEVVCRYNGEEVFRAELGSGVAANPYLQFHTIAETSGEFVFEWVDDAGERGVARARIEVTD